MAETPNETHMRHVSEWQNPKPIGNMEEFITRILYSLFRDAIREGAVSVVIQQDLQRVIAKLQAEHGQVDFRMAGVPIVNLTPESILAVWSVLSYESKGAIPMQPHVFLHPEKSDQATIG